MRLEGSGRGRFPGPGLRPCWAQARVQVAQVLKHPPPHSVIFNSSIFFFILFIYLTESEQEREGGVRRAKPTPLRAGISGPWDHDLSWRQMPN